MQKEKRCGLIELHILDVPRQQGETLTHLLKENADLDEFFECMVGLDSENRVCLLNEEAEMDLGISSRDAQGREFTSFPSRAALFVEVAKMAPKILFSRKEAEVPMIARMFFVGENALGIAAMLLYTPVSRFLVSLREKDLAVFLDFLNQMQSQLQEINFILDEVYDLITVTDGQGKALLVNAAAEKVFGIKENELIGSNARDLERQGVITESSTVKVLREKARVTLTQTTKNNRILAVTGIPIFDDQGNISRVFNISQDITEVSNLKKRLQESESLLSEYDQQLRGTQYKAQLWGGFVTSSIKMEEILKAARQVMDIDATVLIRGESGVGKDVLAQAIHNTSNRSKGRFIKINCGAIPETLLESMLFGYVKGAFTGALDTGKQGLLQDADNGTLFLDEIGDLPLSLQVKILEFVQYKTFLPVGGNAPIKVNVKIIAATNRDLREMVANRTFREDLYYRLNVFHIYIPPLRERQDEIPVLADMFLREYNELYKVKKRISVEAIEALIHYEWPGNVRELRNLIERLVIMVDEEVIGREHLPEEILKSSLRDPIKIEINQLMPLREAQELLERKLYEVAVKVCASPQEAADLLGVHRTTVSRNLQKYAFLKK